MALCKWCVVKIGSKNKNSRALATLERLVEQYHRVAKRDSEMQLNYISADSRKSILRFKPTDSHSRLITYY